MSKPRHYIKWVEKGEQKTKSYSSKQGLSYHRKKVVKLLGEDAILEEGITTGEDEISLSVKEKPLGKIDTEHSRLDADGTTGGFVLSNWNTVTKSYTSRVYGSLNDFIKIIEPDGSISLNGYAEEIIRKIDKKGNRIFVDGRVFDPMGWPVVTK